MMYRKTIDREVKLIVHLIIKKLIELGIQMAKLTRKDIYDTAKELSNWGRWGDDDQIGTLLMI